MNELNKERFMYILGGGVVGLSVFVLALMIFKELPATNKDIINIAVGSLMTMAGNVVGYFFGSSKSSADKTQIMAKAAEDAH